MNFIRSKSLLFLILSLSFAHCASAHKTSQKHMENQAYEEAADTYESILRSNPSDTEAVAGLKTARGKVIEKKLIDIRMARLGGNPDSAVSMLLDLIHKEKDWEMQPKGTVAFTQSEEIEYSSKHLIKKLSDSVQKKQPLVTENLIKTYDVFFQENKTAKFDAIKKENVKIGKSECHHFTKLGFKSSPYFAEFVDKYCSYFGEQVELSGYHPELKLNSLIQHVTATGNVSNLPQEAYAELRESLNQTFSNNPWHHPQGKAELKLGLSGEYQFDQQRTPIQLVHQYTETERYVSLESVRKTREVPYRAYENVYDYQSGRYNSVSVTKYRTEEYYVNEPVERYRDVQKYYPYGAWKIIQKIKLGLQGKAALKGKELEWSISDEANQEDTQSDVNMPNIGLRPKEPTKIADPKAWIKEMKVRFTEEFNKQLLTSWTELNCTEDSKLTSFSDVGNRVQLCLRKSFEDPPRFVKDWYLKYFGLEVKPVDELLRITHSNS